MEPERYVYTIFGGVRKKFVKKLVVVRSFLNKTFF